MHEPTLDVAKNILQILGQCRCDAAAVDGPLAPSVLASMNHPFAGDIRKRVVLARDAARTDLACWAAAEAPGTGLLVLASDDEFEAARDLCGRAADQGRAVQVQRWSEFVSQYVKLRHIQDHYSELQREYLETEGEEFVYIDPTVVDEEARKSRKLSDWTRAHDEAGKGGIVFLAAEYGEGKTSFCLNYVFRCLRRPDTDGGVPLLFTLSECKAGSLESFILDRLWSDYRLPLLFSEFKTLCRLGVFIPVFDAFDQMHHEEAGSMRIERDHGCIQDLQSEVVPLYVTCRLDFYNQHVKPLRDRLDQVGEHPSSHLLLLRGFDDDDVRQLLHERLELLDLLVDPANQEVLGGINHKPLTLHVIVHHAEAFRELLDETGGLPRPGGPEGTRRARITEYDVFNLLYKTWLKKIQSPGFPNNGEAILVARAITAWAQLEARNLARPFSDLANIKECAELFNTPTKRDAILEALKQLPLLDQAKLRRPDQPLIVFRFNAYLEFLTARFVLDELSGPTIPERAFVKLDFLTWETRRMITPNLRVDDHGEKLWRVVQGTRLKHFRDVLYQGSNALTLFLIKLQDPEIAGRERDAWHRLLRGASLKSAVLRRLDARAADLTGCDFSSCDLRDADFSYATLRNASFALANLEGAVFQEAGALLTTVFIRPQGADDQGWLFAGGTRNGMLVFWDSTSRYSKVSHPHFEAITAVDMRQELRRLYSASLEGALCDTSVDDPNSIRRYPLAIGGLRAMVLTGDGRKVIVGGDRRGVLVRDLDRGESHRLELPTARGAVVTSLALDERNDPGALFVGDSDGDLFKFDDWRHPTTGQQWGENPGGPVRALIALADGTVLALAADGQAVLLDGTGRRRQDQSDDGPMNAVCYARQVDTLFWLDGRRLKKRDRRTDISGPPEAIGFLPEPLERAILACSSDGTFIAAGGEHLVVWRSSHAGLSIDRTESMRMDCAGMILHRARGLGEDTAVFLVERGAVK